MSSPMSARRKFELAHCHRRRNKTSIAFVNLTQPRALKTSLAYLNLDDDGNKLMSGALVLSSPIDDDYRKQTVPEAEFKVGEEVYFVVDLDRVSDDSKQGKEATVYVIDEKIKIRREEKEGEKSLHRQFQTVSFGARVGERNGKGNRTRAAAEPQYCYRYVIRPISRTGPRLRLDGTDLVLRY